MAKNDDRITQNDKRLIDLLKDYPHPNRDIDDVQGLIICVVLSARENGWTEEFIRICRRNPDVTFDEILDLIITEERYPPIEIVDDDDEE